MGFRIGIYIIQHLKKIQKGITREQDSSKNYLELLNYVHSIERGNRKLNYISSHNVLLGRVVL